MSKFSQLIFTSFLIYFAIVSKAQITSLSVSSTDYTVNISPKYTFTITFKTGNVPSSEKIIITLPTDFALESEPLSCQKGLGFQGTPSCQSYAGNNSIVISDGGPYNIPPVLVISIDGIVNPKFAGETGFISVSTKDSSSNTLSFTTTKGIRIVPGAILNPEFSSDVQTTGTVTTLTITFETTNGIPKDSIVRVKFPKYNNEPEFQDVLEAMIIQDPPICSPITGVDNTINCDLNEDTLIVNNAFRNSDEYNDQVSFSVGSFRNPFSTSPKGPITIETVFNSRLIDQDTNLHITVSEPIEIEGENLFVEEPNINFIAQYTFFFFNTLYLQTGGTFDITFPAEYTLDENIVVVAYDPLADSTELNRIIDTDNNIISVTDAIEESVETSSILIIVQNVKNPGQTLPVSGFEILIKDSLGASSQLVKSLENWSFTPLPGLISPAEVEASTFEIRKTTDFLLKFTLSNILPSTAYIRIVFPDTLSIDDFASQQCPQTDLLAIDTNANCVLSSRELIISDPFPAGITEPTAVQIRIGDFTFPNFAIPPGNFSIETFTAADGEVVDRLDDDIIESYTPGPIDTLQGIITMSNVETYNLADYTFAFITPHSIPQGGYISVEFPEEIDLSSANTCTILQGFLNSVNCVIDADSNTITLRNGFSSGESDSTSEEIQFRVRNIRNPRTTTQTQSIILTTWNTDGYAVDQASSGLEITASEASSLTKIEIIADSYEVGITNDYEFVFTPFAPVLTGDKIEISFPSQIGINQPGFQCVNLSPTLLSAANCQLELANRKIIITLDVVDDEELIDSFSVRIDELTNPSSTSASSYFTINVYDFESNFVQQYNNQLVFQTCSSPCVTCMNSDDYCLSCEAGDDPYVYQGSCYDECPDGATVEGFTCLGCDLESNCFSCEDDQKDVCLTCPTSHPLLSQVDSKCYDVCPDGQAQDGSADRCIACSPASNCETCESNDSTKCLTCRDGYPMFSQVDERCYAECPSGTYQQGDVCQPCGSGKNCGSCAASKPSVCLTCPGSHPFYDPDDKDCNSKCPDGTVQLSNDDDSDFEFICEPCKSSSHCKTCDDTNLAKCTSCPAAYPLLGTTDSKCYSVNCPEGETLLQDLCVPCNSNCNNCYPNELSRCADCNSGQFLSMIDERCYDSCPQGTYLEQANGRCEPCDEKCTKCEDVPTTCTACADEYLLFNVDKSCRTECPEGYGEIEGICFSESACSLGCQSCLEDRTCLGCQAGLLLVDDLDCVATCPSGYIQKEKICEPCDVVACAVCESQDTCQACSIGFVLSADQQCLGSCPSNYFSRDGVCLDCPYKCTSCSDENTCLACNDGYALDDNGDCQEAIPTIALGAYFPFIIIGVIVLIPVTIIEFKKKDNLYYNNLLAIMGFLEAVSWLFLFILYFAEGELIAGAFMLLFYMINATFNVFFRLKFYSKLMKEDPKFSKWRKKFKKQVKVFEILGLIFTLKILRLTFGRMFKKGWFNGIFTKDIAAIQAHNKYALMTFIGCNLPTFVLSVVMLNRVLDDSQLYAQILENFGMNLIIGVLTAICICRYANEKASVGDLSMMLRNYSFSLDMDELINGQTPGEKADKQKIQVFLKEIKQKPDPDDVSVCSVKVQKGDFGNFLRQQAEQGEEQGIYVLNDSVMDTTLGGMGTSKRDKINYFQIKNIKGLKRCKSVGDKPVSKLYGNDQRRNSLTPDDEGEAMNFTSVKINTKWIVPPKGLSKQESKLDAMNEEIEFHLNESVSDLNNITQKTEGGRLLSTIKEHEYIDKSEHQTIQPEVDDDTFERNLIEISGKDDIERLEKIITQNSKKKVQFNVNRMNSHQRRIGSQGNSPIRNISPSNIGDIVTQHLQRKSSQNYYNSSSKANTDSKLNSTQRIPGFSNYVSNRSSQESPYNQLPSGYTQNGKKVLIPLQNQNWVSSQERARTPNRSSTLNRRVANALSKNLNNDDRSLSPMYQDGENIEVNNDFANVAEYNNLTRNLPVRPHTVNFNREDDSIARLMKLTMINSNYKRDLQNNKIIEKSTYGYDASNKDDYKLKYQDSKNEYVSFVQKIKDHVQNIKENQDSEDNLTTTGGNEPTYSKLIRYLTSKGSQEKNSMPTQMRTDGSEVEFVRSNNRTKSAMGQTRKKTLNQPKPVRHNSSKQIK